MAVHSRSNAFGDSAPLMPFDVRLAPVTVDGFAKWVLCAQDYLAYYIAMCAPEAGPSARYFSARTQWPDLHLSSPKLVETSPSGIWRVVTGFFHDKTHQSICLVFRQTEDITGPPTALAPSFNRVELWDVSSSGTSISKVMSQSNCGAGHIDFMGTPMAGTSVCLDGELVCGDFDGDGLEELINFRLTEGKMTVYKYDLSSRQFLPMPHFTPGNLSDLTKLKLCHVWSGHFADFPGEGRRDGLIFQDYGTGELHRFDSRVDPKGPPGNTTFWWAFSTGGGVAPNTSQMALADVNGDGFEECVVYDAKGGKISFLSLASIRPGVGLVNLLDPGSGASPGIETGQLSLVPEDNRWMFWGKLKSFPGEAGNTNVRDDVVFYSALRDEFARYDARWNAAAGKQTYWWANTVRAELVRVTMR